VQAPFKTEVKGQTRMAIGGSSRKSGKKGKKRKDEAVGPMMGTRLYAKDLKEFGSIAKREFRGNEAQALRELVSESLTTRRLRAAGRDAGLSAVKEAQKEVVSGETGELKILLTQALSLLRGLGSLGDKIMEEVKTGEGLSLLALASALHIEQISEERMLKPSLLSDGFKGDVDEAIQESEHHWLRQAKIMAEGVRNKVHDNDV
jgi:hypothetical protein